MKVKIWSAILVLAMLTLASAGQAQLLIKLVTGKVLNPDATLPKADEWAFCAYLTSEIDDTTATDSCADKGGWAVSLMDFNALGKSWTAGDTLVVLFKNIAGGSFDGMNYKITHRTTNDEFQQVGDVVLPVELTLFEAQAENDQTEDLVVLSWRTVGESNNLGFQVEKAGAGQEFVNIGFIAGAGSTNQAQAYRFEDRDVQVGSYRYRLKQIDTDGSFTYSEIVQVTVMPPQEYALSQNYPNPFNPETHIAFQVKQEGRVTIKVYDILGRETATLLDQTMKAGTHKLSFDGRAMPSGLYFYAMQAGDFRQVKKMMLLK
ncbi:MAG TPA: T9SS type A sorting domain-containing protein [bacterium]|nr:T9SS type A sorting domain-containing protein [bacterium]HOX85051.1 T9SS type A sorting domain-containing protein [bacterium]HPG44083.1 T9SS type A sorting domain-containing protein [bacterium]HPM96449.1 T9SS type A sorting domain-containing protein [bacterium]